MAQLDGYKTEVRFILSSITKLVLLLITRCTFLNLLYRRGEPKLPVLHVNADDAEAVVHAMSFALDFRMEFGRDVLSIY
jgi:2-oxoglutarate dehydrogenase E1 component